MKTKIIAGTFLSLWIAGCATAPPAPPAGRADLLDFLADGRTTKIETLSQLGEPSGKFDGEKILTYRLGGDREKSGYVVKERQVFQSQHGWPDWVGTKYSLVLIYDEQGILRKHSLVEVK